MATWFQGPAADFIRVSREGFERGVNILHFLGGTSIDLAPEHARAIAQTKMTISQRAEVHGIECDVVCTGRFYDFLEKRDDGWGIVLRQPIYEKDRLDPVDPAATLDPPTRIARPVPDRLPPPRVHPDRDRLRGQTRHAGPDGARGPAALRPRQRTGSPAGSSGTRGKHSRYCATAADPATPALERIRSAARSAIMITGAFVLPRVISGITDASTTRRPSTP